MPISVASLPVVALDYSGGGPILHVGLSRLNNMLEAERGREGYLLVNVIAGGATIPIVLARADLYVVGFQCGTNWFCFDDAAWPFSDAVTKLGYEGQYGKLGGLAGNITLGSIQGIARLANIADRPDWKEPLRTLLVVVSECSRLIPVQMYVLGVMNGVLPFVPLASLAHYIQNWAKASKGTDMSRPVTGTLRTGFKDPTILKR